MHHISTSAGIKKSLEPPPSSPWHSAAVSDLVRPTPMEDAWKDVPGLADLPGTGQQISELLPARGHSYKTVLAPRPPSSAAAAMEDVPTSPSRPSPLLPLDAPRAGLEFQFLGAPPTQLDAPAVAASNRRNSSSFVSPALSAAAADAGIVSFDRRRRKLIKNREFAARSRARKQAHTNELELEVADLKEENARLKMQHKELCLAMASQPSKRTQLQRSSSAPF